MASTNSCSCMHSVKAHGALQTTFHIRRTESTRHAHSTICNQEQISGRCSRHARKVCLLVHLDLVGDVDPGAGLGHVVQQQDREVGWEVCCQCARLTTV